MADLDAHVRQGLDGFDLDPADLDRWAAEAEATTAPVDTGATDDEETTMLLRYTALSPDAKAHFGLSRDPFHNEIRSRDDLFLTPPARAVREAMWQTAKNGGFMAVIGESGAGKTLLREDLFVRASEAGEDIRLIMPHVEGMEENDKKGGHTLRSADIVEAIIQGLEPGVKMRHTRQGKLSQLEQLLRANRRAGVHAVLIIEEAHCMPKVVLKHLKRFLELKDGFTTLLAIIMLGQTELYDRLSESDASVREVTQRCEIVGLPPLGGHLGAYLDHKFARLGVNRSEVLADDAVEALRVRLNDVEQRVRGQHVRTDSLVYPLAIGNLTNAALNAAAKVGDAKVTAARVQKL
ncbi:MAG: AAA family ATPase [Gammaproteobacteria bacterium]|nr:AAA family ATPase [Gammaproteobacteria bacterium]